MNQWRGNICWWNIAGVLHIALNSWRKLTLMTQWRLVKEPVIQSFIKAGVGIHGNTRGDGMKKSYYAIIPANVRDDKELISGAKLLYGEITALCNEKGYCWANNAYFAGLYEVSNVTISTWVNQLARNGYIRTEMIYKESTKEILNRYIRIVNDPIKEKINTPIKEKHKDSTTSTNTTINKDHAAKIKELLSVFSTIPNFTAINKKYCDAIRETRVTTKVAESVIYRNMNAWKKYDPIVVERSEERRVGRWSRSRWGSGNWSEKDSTE